MLKTIFSLAFEGIKRRKRQSLLIFFVLLISFAFAIMLLSYTTSIATTNMEYLYDTYGEWYGTVSYDLDDEFLESAEWLDVMGTSTYYGSLSASMDSDCSIGVVDEGFITVGRISLNSGRLPESSGEIAMEASLLSELGYDYTLGQEIELTVYFQAGASTVAIVKTYTLCGVIKEYTGLWSLSYGMSGELLNGAFIIPDDAEALYEEAQEIADLRREAADDPAQASMIGNVSASTSYFFTVKPGYEKQMEDELNSYLQTNYSESATVIINDSVYGSGIASDYNTNMVYIAITFAVTILAVIVIYVLQMQSDIRRIVRLRSLGATKAQVRLLVGSETLMVCIPATIFGAIAGAFGVWLLLRLSLYTGSVDIIISIPWDLLLAVVIVWYLSIMLVRMLTIQVALATSLTGRMGMKARDRKNHSKIQSILVILMATTICTTVIYTTHSLLSPVYTYDLYSSMPSYLIDIRYDLVPMDDSLVSTISSVPGVTKTIGYTGMIFASLNIDGESPDIYVYVLDDEDFSDIIDFSQIDINDYRNGESVILSIPTNYGEYYIPEVGADVSMTVMTYLSFSALRTALSRGVGLISENTNEYVTFTNIDVTVGAINYYEAIGEDYWLAPTGNLALRAYTIICSPAFFKKVLDAIPEGTYWQYFKGGEDAGYDNVIIYANLNAEYLSTDTAIAGICADEDLYLTNNRELNASKVQVALQSIILIAVGGISIAFIAIMILQSTIKLETQRERRKFGILQALGMSRHQRNLRLIKVALLRSIVAVISGWGVFVLAVIFANSEKIRAGETALSVLQSYYSNLERLYAIPVPPIIVVMTIALFAAIFLICYIPKLSMNKYTLMEMLHDE